MFAINILQLPPHRRMKWSKFIQDDNKLKDYSPASKLNSSKGGTSSQGRELALKSIEKVRMDTSSSRLRKNVSTSSINSNQIRSKQLISKHISIAPPRQLIHDFQSTPNFNSDSRFKTTEINDITRLMDQFSREFSDFVKTFMEKVEAVKNNKEFRDEISKRMIASTQEIISRYTIDLQKEELRSSPVRKSLSCLENNISSMKPKQQGSDKKKTRILQFKNEKVQEKNTFSRIENTFQRVNSILENEKRPPKFVRTSRLKKHDRSGDSSASEIIERSLSDSKKAYKSRLKSKDVLYNMNKILNQ